MKYKLNEKEKRMLRKFCKKGVLNEEAVSHMWSEGFISDALHDGLIDLVCKHQQEG